MVGVLSLIQTFGFSISGVLPNLALATTITSFFFISYFWQGILISILASLILKFSPGFEIEILVFFLICLIVLLLKKYSWWHNFFTNLFFIALGTLVFYLLLEINFIPTAVFFKELIFNLIAGVLIFAILSWVWQNKNI